MTEAELQDLVVGLARWAGYLDFHIRDSRKNTGVGFPDLILLHKRTGNLVVAELKSDKGKPTGKQLEWLDAFGKQHTTFLWRPADWHNGSIQRVLTQDGQVAA